MQPNETNSRAAPFEGIQSKAFLHTRSFDEPMLDLSFHLSNQSLAVCGGFSLGLVTPCDTPRIRQYLDRTLWERCLFKIQIIDSIQTALRDG